MIIPYLVKVYNDEAYIAPCNEVSMMRLPVHIMKLCVCRVRESEQMNNV